MRDSSLVGMPASSSTTIKVQKNLRERISRVAAAEGRTAAGLISQLLDEHERQARFASVRNAYATADADTNEAYVNEAADWDSRR